MREEDNLGSPDVSANLRFLIFLKNKPGGSDAPGLFFFCLVPLSIKSRDYRVVFCFSTGNVSIGYLGSHCKGILKRIFDTL